MKYTRIRPDWYRVATQHGAFYATTLDEAISKASLREQTANAQTVAADFRTDERPDFARHGYVIVNPIGNAACWIVRLDDPGGWLPGTMAVDACGSVWMNLGLDEHTGGATWEQVHEAFAHVPPQFREEARREHLAALAFTETREAAQC